MANTCTICKHNNRSEIEELLAAGKSLRDIAGQFQVSKSSVDRHQRCIATQLEAFKESRSEQLNESLMQRLERYRRVAEQFLSDDEKALVALDRCYKQVDIEAKLTGEYQKKQENKPDQHLQRAIFLETVVILAERKGEAKSLEQVEAEFEMALAETQSVWAEAEVRVKARGWVR